MNSVGHFARDNTQNVRSAVQLSSSVSRLRVSQVSVTSEIPVRSRFQRLRNAVSSPVPSKTCLVTLAVADLIGVLLAAGAARWSLGLATPDSVLATYWAMWPAFGCVLVTNLLFGMYSASIVDSVQELRRHALASCSLFLVLICMVSIVPHDLTLSRQLLTRGWLISLALVPATRAIAKAYLSRFSWWRQSAVVLVTGNTGQRVVDQTPNQQGVDIRPVVIVNDTPVGRGVPVVTRLDVAPVVVDQFGARCAIVAIAGAPHQELISQLENQARTFTTLKVDPDPFDFSTIWVSPRGSGDILAVEVRPALLGSTAQRLKRVSDIIGVMLLGILALPLIALIALAIKLDSKGPVMYGHRRSGQGGRAFLAWKFRSMVVNADTVLSDHLQRDPKARDEWEAIQKLRNDPRVTRIGRLLRKSSLDELPQLWNVLVGEMSLVGPRPIVNAEKRHYRERLSLYERVLPGLSGLWQVSGRNDTTYQERVELDSYYVRNWSFWLDICILVRTIPAMLFGRGAC